MATVPVPICQARCELPEAGYATTSGRSCSRTDLAEGSAVVGCIGGGGMEKHAKCATMSTCSASTDLSSATVSPRSSPSLASERSAQTSEASSSPRPVTVNLAAMYKECNVEEKQDQWDVELVASFVDVMGLPELEANASKILVRSFHFLRSCGYVFEDICIMLAYASVYFRCICERCGKMSDTELADIIVVLMYLAHSYIFDEHCPLCVWHENLFKNRCKISMLNQVLMGIMSMRGYVLRADADEIEERYARLLAFGQRASH